MTNAIRLARKAMKVLAMLALPTLAFGDECEDPVEVVPQTPEISSYRLISDTFTVGRGGRTDGYYQNLPNTGDSTVLKQDAGYLVEGSASSIQWMPPRNGSFNTPTTAVKEYAGVNTGNSGATGGFLQSGAGVIAMPCPQLPRVTYEMDARWHTTKCDYIAIGYFSSEFPTMATGYLVSFHKDGSVKIIRQNAAAVDTGLRTGIADPNAAWHNFAVTFDFAAQTLDVYVDRVLLGRVKASDVGCAFLSSRQTIGMGCSGYVAWFDNVQVGNPANFSTGIGLNSNERAVILSGALGNVVNDGQVIKSGTGDASLTAPAGAGELRVDAGCLTLVGGMASLPASLQEGLAFWVDANRNVIAADGNLTWYDVRETANGSVYTRACTFESAEATPTQQTDAQGHKWIDFGVYGGAGASWLQWRDGVGAVKSIVPQTVFYVAACPNGGGRFLTSYDGGEGAGATCWSPTETAGMMSSFVVGDDLFGAVWKSGVFQGSGTTVSLTSPASVYVLRKATNYSSASGVSAFDNMQGGGRLGEVLVYTTSLSDEKILAISHYLQHKWNGEPSMETIMAASGAHVTVEANSVKPIVIGRDDGQATLNIVGTGSVKMKLGAHPIVLEKGKAYTSDTSGISVGAGTVSTIVVSGDGVVSTVALNQEAPVTVTSGELRLTGFPTSDVAVNLLANGSFETYTRFSAADPASMYYGYNPTLPGWTFVGSAGLASRRASVGFLPEQAPDGEYAAFVQAGDNPGMIEQTFAIAEAGNYELSFITGYRTGTATPFLQVLVDDVSLCTIHIINKTFKRCYIFVPGLVAGNHTLRFQAVNKGVDAMADIDDVVLSRAANQNANLIIDGCFESAELTTYESGTGVYYDYSPVGTGWVFVDPSNSSVKNSGVSEMCGVWGHQVAPDGGKFAFLRQNGYLARDIEFAEPGTYRLTFKVAARVYYNSNGRVFWAAPQDYQIKLGETVVASLRADQASFREYSVRLPIVAAAGTQRLAFVGTSGTSKDVAALFDDVRVEQEISLVGNPGFESRASEQFKYNPDGEGWTYAGLSGVARRNSALNHADVEPEGIWSAFLQQDGRISQAVTPDKSGFYRLRFSAAWRGAEGSGHRFRILCGGMLLGEVDTGSNRNFSEYSFRTPFLKAGVPVEIAFAGVKPPDDRTSILDNISLLWESNGSAFDANAFSGAAVELLDGAKLGLDFGGRIELKSLKVGARNRSGLLTAANTDFIVGAGSIYIPPPGMVLIVR